MEATFVLWAGYYFYPLFAFAAFLEFLGSQFFQAFFAGLVFAIIQGTIIVTVIIMYWLWEGKYENNDLVLRLNGYNKNIWSWISLLVFELATVVASIFVWDATLTDGNNPVLVKYAILQTIEGFVYWRGILVLVLLLVIPHIRYSMMTHRSIKMVDAKLKSRGTKKDA